MEKIESWQLIFDLNLVSFLLAVYRNYQSQYYQAATKSQRKTDKRVMITRLRYHAACKAWRCSRTLVCADFDKKGGTGVSAAVGVGDFVGVGSASISMTKSSEKLSFGMYDCVSPSVTF